nr:septal ring lytic transglycosylase RlpA family protein [uncultured Undibacterium sp.]
MQKIQPSLGHLSLLSLILVVACSSPPKVIPAAKEVPVTSSVATATTAAKTTANKPPHPILPKANSGKGGYYLDDGPGDDIPEGLESTVDPIPTVEPYSRTGNKPYKVFGKEYTPINDSTTPFKQRGVASWYGKKFHGKRTSSGEPYDMYKITAAHPTLPIPSYARVTNLSNGKQIIVRINDRGPFHSSRIMDLSYTAALKLAYLGKGSSEVELERLLPEDIAKMAENSQNQLAVNTAVAPSSTATTGKNEKDGISLETMIAAQERIIKTELSAKDNKPIVSAEANTATSATSATKGSFYLQFAAFAIRANAEASLAHLQQLLKSRQNRGDIAADISLEIVQQGNLYRLQSGPYLQRDKALAAAQEFAVGSAKPIVIQR